MLNKKKILSLSVLLFGMLYCLASLFGLTEAICHTSGCQIYKSYSVLGLSLYAWGVMAFGLGLLLHFFRDRLIQTKLYFDPYLVFLGVCFVGEIGLLFYQAVYLPCISCLVVGFLWGMLFVLEMNSFRNKVLPIAGLIVWFFLISGNLVSAGKEMIKPWPIYGSVDAPVKIFFSPTCPACKEAVREIVSGGLVDTRDIALFPVAKDEKDQERICLLQCSLRNQDNQEANLETALNKCWQPECEPISVGLWDELRLKVNLLRNKAYLFRLGIKEIPVVISNRPLIKEEGFDLLRGISTFSTIEEQGESHSCSILHPENCTTK